MVGESSQIAWCSGDIMTCYYFTEFANDKLQEKQLKIWGHLDNLSHLKDECFAVFRICPFDLGRPGPGTDFLSYADSSRGDFSG